MIIADEIADRSARGEPINIDGLGGASAFTAQAAALARSPYLDVLTELAATALHDDAPHLDAVVLRGFEESSNPTAMRDALGVILANHTLFLRLSPRLPKILEARVEADRSVSNPLLAAYALEGLFCFALAGWVSKHRVMGPLAESQPDHNGLFAEHAAKLAGAAYGVWRDNDLLATLERLQLNNDARGEANFELGLVHLVRGLESQSAESALDSLASSAAHFNQARIADEDRSDAVALAAAIKLVEGFHRGFNAAALAAPLIDLEHAVADRQALLHLGALPTWLSDRADREVAWVQLLRLVQHLAGDLQRPSWLKAAAVMDQVLTVYDANRTLMFGTGFETLVRPTIEAAFVRERGLRAHLDDLLTDKAWIGDQRESADALRARIADLEMESSPGKSTGGGPYPLLEGLLRSEPTTSSISPELCQKAEAALEQYGVVRVMPGNPIVQRVFATVQNALVACPDYTLGVKDDFDALALQVIMFCKDRQDAGVKELGRRGSYLRDPDATEFDLQTDLREWLSGNYLRGQILTEVEGVATGRADVYVSLGSHRFIIELKRSHEQVSPEHARNYMAQATGYQSTNVKLGMLGILEIVERSAPPDALDECIWPDSFSTSATAIPRYLMVFKVPGRLVTPHSFSPATRKPRKKVRTAPPNLEC